MPIPSLPIEIIREIASHLCAPVRCDCREAVDIGKAMSLVSRVWHSVGRALRWRSLRIEATSVDSLLAHVNLHPNLPLLPKNLELTFSSEDPIEEEDEVGERKLRRVNSLLSLLIGLLSLDVEGPSDRGLSMVCRTAATLPRLEAISIVVRRKLIWTADLASAFANGFTSLHAFRLIVKSLGLDPSVVAPIVRRTVPFQAQHLGLYWRSYSAESPLLVQSFLSSFDTESLLECVLYKSAAEDLAFSWLTTCSNLRTLTITLRARSAASTFAYLISRLPRLLSLRTLEIEAGGTVDSPSALDAVLASFPPQLERFQSRQICFNDYTLIPQLQMSVSRGPCHYLEGLYPDEIATGMDYPLILWASTADPNKWFRHVSTSATWEDLDERYETLRAPSVSDPSADRSYLLLTDSDGVINPAQLEQSS